MYDVLKLDNQVNYGIVLGEQDRGNILKYAPLIESVGFDSIWVGDHVAFHVPVIESMTLLSFIASITQEIKLGTAVYLLPLRHPTLVSKISSTLDVLSGGRLLLGVGVGGEYPKEFDACGVDINERGAIVNESIEVLRKLWSENDVVYNGKYFQFGPVSIDPKPLQHQGPKIIVGGRKNPAFRRAAQLGDGYMSHMCTPDEYSRNLEKINMYADGACRRGLPFFTAAYLFVFLDDSYEMALNRADKVLSSIYNTPFLEAAKKYCLLGTPEQISDQIENFIEAGVRHIIFSVPDNIGEFIDIFDKYLKCSLKRQIPS